MELQKQHGEHKYLAVYNHYRELIMTQRLRPGSRMPSLRKSTIEHQLSRTTVETAYLLLAAEGYIVSRPQSGYYVTNISLVQKQELPAVSLSLPEIKYDLSSSGVDQGSFHFDVWRRYIKSALRQDHRLLSYGEPQGERDLREALAEYVHQRRNVICSSDDIVIGSGVQSLLQILCPLVKDKVTVSFPNPSFIQGSTIFSDHGFEIHYRDKNCGVIYVSPAHMTKWGEIMPVKRRLELIRHAADHGSLIIEDDFENEFVYLQRPTPSLYSLAGGEGVIYVGSFSKLLLPSIRISFMVLPPQLAQRYHQCKDRYNQTASKTEQIALCQFIRDGHLAAQTRKLRRLYAQKLKLLQEAVLQVFGADAAIQLGSAGTSLALTLPAVCSGSELVRTAARLGVRIKVLSQEKSGVTLLLSASALPQEDFLPACRLLKEAADLLI